MKTNQGITRNNERGTLSALDGNGFGTFTADSGARYTAHNAEVLLDSETAAQASAKRAMWARWPEGLLSITVQRKPRRAVAMIVKRSAVHYAPERPRLAPMPDISTGRKLRAFVHAAF